LKSSKTEFSPCRLQIQGEKKEEKKSVIKQYSWGGGPPPARKKCLNMFSSCKSESDKENFFLNLEIEDFSWQ